MAVGDIIVGITSGVGVFTNYQPSSSVELIITSITGRSEVQYGQYDGTNFIGTYAYYLPATGEAMTYSKMSEMKLGITNTYYFRFASNNNRAYFSAIQTK